MSFEHLFLREKTSQGVDESFLGPSGRCREQRTSQFGNLETVWGYHLPPERHDAETLEFDSFVQVGALKGRVVYKGTLDALRGIAAAGLSFMCYEALKHTLLEEELV
jgi:hypothetical protein